MIIRKKEFGGLGMDNLMKTNRTCQIKRLWEVTHRNTLWGQLARQKYKKRMMYRSLTTKHTYSNQWKEMQGNNNQTIQHGSYVLGNENNANFRKDSWSHVGPLWKIFYGPFSQRSLCLTVKESQKSELGWDENGIQYPMSEWICTNIGSIKLIKRK